ARAADAAELVAGRGDRGLPLRPAGRARAARRIPAAGPAARPLALWRLADRNLAPRFLEPGDAALALAAHGRAPEPHQPRRPALGLWRAGPGALWDACRAGPGPRLRPRAGRQAPRRVRRPARRPSARPHRPVGLRGGASRSARGGAGRSAPVLLAGSSGAGALGDREAGPARSLAAAARRRARP